MTAPPAVFTPSPSAVAASRLMAFMRHCAEARGTAFADYAAFHRFSVDRYPEFWRLFLEWSALPTSGSPDPACRGGAVQDAEFFPQLALNYAESLIGEDCGAPESGDAVIGLSETGPRRRWTRAQLRTRVQRMATGLGALGFHPGERAVAIARNTPDTIAAHLGVVAAGLTWSSASPDLGADSVVSRFRPLDPSVLFVHAGAVVHGVHHPLGDRVAEVVRALPHLRAVIVLDDEVDGLPTLSVPVRPASEVGGNGNEVAFRWRRFPFNHPLCVLFSSGTTGAPKGIVHGAGGTLLQHLKEHRLHTDLGPTDRLYFHTTTGWMMWNWQLSALASGTTIILYDGSPTYPDPGALWERLADERVTVFGTSPPYLHLCQNAGLTPGRSVDLSSLRAILSTGSVLYADQYDWVADAVKRVPLQSISGGTDIVGCFVLGNPLLPVYRGESQCVALAMDVRVATSDGLRNRGTGELVCASPFMSRPLGLYGDDDGSRFHDAYFGAIEGVWTHGDFIELTPRGTARVLGRSDGTLNIRGVRIGPAEIYQMLRDVPEVREAMALEQRAPEELGGSRMVLLVILADGTTLDRPLTHRIKRLLRDRGTSAHVPAVVAQVRDLPTTYSGKRSERAATEALHDRTPANLNALRNPEALEEIRALAIPESRSA